MKLVVVLILSLVASAVMNGIYMQNGNPEINFARKVAAEQNRQLDRTDDGPRVIFVGGSSCSFSVDPALLKQEFDLWACNLGLPAGTGRGLHFERALQEAKPGDLVVLAFEMTGWSGQEGEWVTPLGSQFWHGVLGERYRKRSAISESLGIDETYDLMEMRAGGKHTVTMVMKVALRKPLFRYHEKVIRRGGYLCTTENYPLTAQASEKKYHIDHEVAEVLKRFVEVMKSREVKTVVSLPWYYTSESVADSQRSLNRVLANEISVFCPVLEDKRLGVATKKSFFSDTNWHLSETGAQERSRVIGSSIVKFLRIHAAASSRAGK